MVLSVGTSNTNYYNYDDNVNYDGYLTSLLNYGDTAEMAVILEEDFPEKSYAFQVWLVVKNASDEVQTNLKAIMDKFDNVNIVFSTSLKRAEQKKIAEMLKSLDFTDEIAG